MTGLQTLFDRMAVILAVVLCGWTAGCGHAPASGSPFSERVPAEDKSALPGSGRTTDRLLSGRLTITGSSTVAPLAAEIALRFEERHPEVRIDVQTGGSSRGINDVRGGTAEIGMASRALASTESDLTAHQIAVDGICMIVHASNPIDSLTDEQVRAIFRGEISSWEGINGNTLPIVVVNKAAGRATLDVFLRHFRLEQSEIDADIIVGENQQGIKTVAGNPSAIGYVSIGAAGAEIQRGTSIRAIRAGGIAPTTENVASGSFPMTRPLLLVTRGELSDAAKAFIDFAKSSDVADLVEAQYFVPPKN